MIASKRARVLVAGVAALAAAITATGWWAFSHASGTGPGGGAGFGDSSKAGSLPESRREGPNRRAETSRRMPGAPRPAPDDDYESEQTLRIVIDPHDEPASGAIAEITLWSQSLVAAVQADPKLEVPVIKIVADAHGEIRLPPIAEWAEISASKGHARGYTQLTSSSPETALVLRLARHVGALVVDQAGKPRAGVAVAYQWRDGTEWAEGPRIPTDRTGMAWFAAWRPDEPWGRMAPPDTQPTDPAPARPKPMIRLYLAVPVPEPITAPIDIDDIPDEPVRLVLPATGRMTIKLMNADGTPHSGSATVWLDVVPANPAKDPFRRARGFGAGEVYADPPEAASDAAYAWAQGGVVTFPAVPVGSKLVARVRPSETRFRAVDAVFDGPSAEGAEATAEIVCDAPATIVIGRLVLPNGKPPSGGSNITALLACEAAIGFEPWGRTRAWVRLGEAGNFEERFDLDPALAAGTRICFDLGTSRAQHANISHDRILEVRLPSPHAGVFDLGTIVLPELPLLASGIVLDPEGQPMFNATVKLAPGSTSAETYTANDGRFELRGRLPAEQREVPLIVEEGSYCGTTLVVARGATDVSVTLSPAGFVQGSLATAGEKITDVVGTAFEREDGGAPAAIPASANDDHALSSDGGIYVSLCPGRYALKLFAWGDPMPILTVGGLEIVGDELNEDTRIQEIEVASLLATRTVVVRDDRGLPVDLARVSVRASDAQVRAVERTTGMDGRATFRTSRRPVDVVACARGHRSTTLRGVTSSEIVIVVERGTPGRATVTLDPAVALPDPPIRLGATLRRLGSSDPAAGPVPDDASTAFIDRALFGRDRVATLAVPDPGVYAVEIFAVNGARWNHDAAPIVVGEPASQPRITVGTGGKVSVRVGADPAAIAAAVAAVTERW